MFESKEVVKRLVVATLVSVVVGVVFCGGCPKKKEKAATPEAATATDVTNIEPVADTVETKTDEVKLEEMTNVSETGEVKVEGTGEVKPADDTKVDDTKKEG
ncbi:MAG: hypothetical protein LBB04_00895 [Oscillospiraceae bacterium]|jgi:hypothetical protein|nr:hypothetical protein [Oscillospiraceae bacterium]